MASNVKLNGTSGNVYVQSQLVGHVTDTDFTISMATRDISDKSSGGYSEIGESTISGEGTGTIWVNPTTNMTGDDLGDFVLNRTKVSMSVGKGDSGDYYYNFSAYITEVGHTWPIEDTVVCNFSFQTTGTITKLAAT